LFVHFAPLGAIDQHALVLKIASGEWRSDTAADLRVVHGGLATIADLQERGHPRSPAHLAATA